MNENFSIPADQKETTEGKGLRPVEEVVSKINEIHMLHKTHPDTVPVEPSTLHALVGDTEVSEMYNHIHEHRGVVVADIEATISSVRQFVEKELDGLDDEYKQEVTKKLALLSSRGREISLAVRRYVGLLSQFHGLAQRRSRMDPHEFSEKIGEIDKRRRMAHDGLIESLNVYAQTLEWIKKEDLLDGFSAYTWFPSQDATMPSAGSKTFITFSPRFLADRRLIQDWAVSVNLHSQIDEIERIQNEKGDAK